MCCSSHLQMGSCGVTEHTLFVVAVVSSHHADSPGNMWLGMTQHLSGMDTCFGKESLVCIVQAFLLFSLGFTCLKFRLCSAMGHSSRLFIQPWDLQFPRVAFGCVDLARSWVQF